MKQLAGCASGFCPGVFEAQNGNFMIVGESAIANIPPQLVGKIGRGEEVVRIPRDVALEFARAVLAEELQAEFAKGYGQGAGWTEDRY